MRDLKYMKRWRGYLAQVQAYELITIRRPVILASGPVVASRKPKA